MQFCLKCQHCTGFNNEYSFTCPFEAVDCETASSNMVAQSVNFVVDAFLSVLCEIFFVLFLFVLPVLSLFISIVMGTTDVIGGQDIVGFTAGGAAMGAKDKGGGESGTGKPPYGTGKGKGIGNDKVERDGIGEGGRKDVFEEDDEEDDEDKGVVEAA